MIQKIQFRLQIVILLLLTFVVNVNYIFATKITSIKIEGNQRIENNVILKALNIKIGEDVEEERISDLIKKLYAKSLFSKVTINLNKDILVVSVKESSLIGAIEFVGNKLVPTKELLKIISTNKGQNIDQLETTAKGRAVNDSKIFEDIQNIKEIYHSNGFYNVNITHVIKPSRNNTVKLIFTIFEGPKNTVQNIHFSGNVEFNDRELKSAILTKETKWYKFFDRYNVYDPNFLDVDRELLERYYNQRGFADCKVKAISVELSKDQQYFDIFYTLEEGDKYHFGNVDIESDIERIELESLKYYCQEIKYGAVYNATQLELISNTITTQLIDKGFSEINIKIINKKDNKKKLVNVIFKIENAENYFIGNINITGNNKTESNIIRKIIKAQEGEVFKESVIGIAYKNLLSTNYFGNIIINPSIKANNSKIYDLYIKVQEKSTTSINLKASSSGKALGVNLSYQEINLFGSGKNAYISASINTDKILTTSLGFVDPYFLGKNLTSGIKFRRSYKTSNFTKTHSLYQELIDGNDAISNSGSLDVAGNFTSNFGWDVEYALANNSYNKKTKVEDTYYSSLIGRLTCNALDPISNAPKGFKGSITTDFTGVFVGQKFIKGSINLNYYYPIVEDFVALKISGDASFIRPWGNDTLAPQDYFNIEEHAFLGFAEAGMGPRKQNKDGGGSTQKEKNKNESIGIGGQNFIKFKTDVYAPLDKLVQMDIVKEYGFKAHLLLEAGTLWGYQKEIETKYIDSSKAEIVGNDSNIRVSASIGISFKYGSVFLSLPLKYEDHDKIEKWHVIMSQSL